MLSFALVLAVAAAPPARQVRVLIDDPSARLLLLAADRAVSPGPSEGKAAEIMVGVEGDAYVQAGSFGQKLSVGDALLGAGTEPWTVRPRRPGERPKILVLEAPRAGRAWKVGANAAARTPPEAPPIFRALSWGPVYRHPERKALVTIVLNRDLVPASPASYQWMVLDANAEVSEHEHEQEAEILYVLSGKTELTMGGKTAALKAGDAVLIPPATKHSAKVVGADGLRAIQFYLPGGPEQRFKTLEGVRMMRTHGMVQLKAGRLEEALRTFTDCVALAPTYGECHLALGSTYARLLRPKEGHRHYQRFLELEPTHPEAEDVRRIIKSYEDVAPAVDPGGADR